MRIMLICIALIGCLSAFGPAHAQSRGFDSETVLRNVSRDPAGWLEQTSRQILNLAPDGRLSFDRLSEIERVETERFLREQRIQVLQFDLDGDGSIGPQEAPPDTDPRFYPPYLALMLRADEDRDGTLSTDEIQAEVERQAASRRSQNRSHQALMAYDLDGDRVVTIPELIEIVYLAEEFVRTDAANRPATEPGAEQGCFAPVAHEETQLLLVGTQQGNGLSTLFFDSPNEEVRFFDLIVESGEQQLFIVVTSMSAILVRVSGDVDRVEHMVVEGFDGRSGVIGLSEQKVTAGPAAVRCAGTSFSGNDVRRLDSERWLYRIHDRPPDRALGFSALSVLSLPSGTHTTEFEEEAWPAGLIAPSQLWEFAEDYSIRPAEGSDAEGSILIPLRSRMIEIYPLGIADFSPDAVIAGELSPRRHDVLPDAAGVIQLIQSGALEPRSGSQLVLVGRVPRLPPNVLLERFVTILLAPDTELPPHLNPYVPAEDSDGYCLTSRCPMADPDRD